MTQFLGTHRNKLDAKGRVSIPAAFRAALKAQSRLQDALPTVSFVLRPSHQQPCLEAWPELTFDALATSLNRYEQFSQDYEDFAATIYADAYPVETDKEGRIVLPADMVAHAGLTESVVFMGLGGTFQIWEPAAAEKRRAEARERARERRMTLGAAAQ